MQHPAPPALEFFARLSVMVDRPQEVGQTVHGMRRLIPILGGEARRLDWNARVLPGGVDFQLIVNPRLAELDARYVVETDAGDLIYVQNRAVRVDAPEAMSRLIRGVAVDPQLIYFCYSPSFETASPTLGWISELLFVGMGVHRPDRVEMQFFTVA